jgi:hypothetical protein
MRGAGQRDRRMTVIPFPDRSRAGPPRLELLCYVFAAMATLGEPATAADLIEVITEHLGRHRADDVRTQVLKILDYYCRTPLPDPVNGRVFRRVGDGFAYTVEFRTHLALKGVAMKLKPLPDPAVRDQRPEPVDAPPRSGLCS